MIFHEMERRDISRIETYLMDERKYLRVLPASVYQALDPDDLRILAHQYGIYQFPTQELVDWLATQVTGVSAIEIGAGNGSIGRALGIPATDSHQQSDPTTRALYALMGQPCIEYPPDVERLDAAAAIEKYKPHTVIGCWVTQKAFEGDKSGNIHGIDEEALLSSVKRYIVVGNHKVHGEKRIMALPHQELSFPWVVSRASAPELNRIYVWENP